MTSPFDFFRKNQATWMVALLLLTLFAFTIGDTLMALQGGGLPPTLKYMIAILCMTGIFWAFGIRTGNSKEYAGVGAIAGVALGFVLVTFGPQGPPPVVETSFGVYASEDLRDIASQQQTANVFVERIRESVDPTLNEVPPEFAGLADQLPPGMFQQFLAQSREQKLMPYRFRFGRPGGSVEEELILAEILRKEADELGIEITDDTISEWIKTTLGENRLQADTFRKIVADLNTTQNELYDALRANMKAQMALELLAPPVAPSPVDFWTVYRDAAYQADLSYVSLPVEAFREQVGEPTDEEIKELFEEYKAAQPTGDKPGFMQDRRVKLAFLEADLAEIRESITVTDEEVEAFYEENKDRLFRIAPEDPGTGGGDPSFPGTGSIPGQDFTPSIPDFLRGPGNDTTSPPDENDPQTDSPTAPKPSSTESETEDPTEPEDSSDAGDESESSEEKPETGEPSEEDPDSESKQPEMDDDEMSRLDYLSRTRPVMFVQGDGDAAEVPVENDTEAEPASEDDSVGESDSESTTDDESVSDGGAGAVSDGTDNADGEAEPEDAGPKYRPLTASLRREIRASLVTEKAREIVQDRMEGARDKLSQLADQYDALEAENPLKLREKRKDFAEKIREEMLEYAKANNLSFGKTPKMSRSELTGAAESFPVVAATAPPANPNPQQRPTPGPSGAQIAFDQLASDLYRGRLVFSSGSTGEGRETIFLLWKTIDEPPHVPVGLEEDGVRAQVVDAWKTLKARELAEERAEELREKAEASEEGFELAFVEETLLGNEDSEVLIPVESNNFSKLGSRTTPDQELGELRDLSPGILETVEGDGPADQRTRIPSEDLTKAIFEELDEGDITIGTDVEGKNVYVVQLRERRPSTDEEKTESLEPFLRQDFVSSQGPFRQRVRSDIDAQNLWLQKLFEKYDVKFPSDLVDGADPS